MPCLKVLDTFRAALGRRDELRWPGLLSQERIELLLSWRRSGFFVHNRVYVHAGDRQGKGTLVRYMMRSPVSLSRLRITPGSPEAVYLHKGEHGDIEPTEGERVNAMELRQSRAAHRR